MGKSREPRECDQYDRIRLGKALQKVRVKARLSQQRLGMNMGIREAVISRWECGRVVIDDLSFAKYALACGCKKKDIIDVYSKIRRNGGYAEVR